MVEVARQCVSQLRREMDDFLVAGQRSDSKGRQPYTHPVHSAGRLKWITHQLNLVGRGEHLQSTSARGGWQSSQLPGRAHSWPVGRGASIADIVRHLSPSFQGIHRPTTC